MNNMAEERGEFEIVMHKKAELAVCQHCDLVRIKDEVFKTRIACRHCEIVLNYFLILATI